MDKKATPTINDSEFIKFLTDSVDVIGSDKYLRQRDKAEERILSSIKSSNINGGFPRLIVPFMLAFLSIVIVFGGINWFSSRQSVSKQSDVSEDLLAEDIADINALLIELDQLYQDTEIYDQQIDFVSIR